MNRVYNVVGQLVVGTATGLVISVVMIKAMDIIQYDIPIHFANKRKTRSNQS